ncbi:MAG: T9SS type A sorting domain-containing protein [Chitinophagales bacterium]
MGQDNRIYFTTVYGYDTGPLTPVTDYNTYLSVITNPNKSGADCNVEPYSIWLCNGLLTEGVPNMPNYRLGALQGSECDTLSTAMQIEIPAHDVFTIYPNPVSAYIEIQHNKQEPLTIIIRDMQGRVCLLLQSFTEAIIQVENFASGVYAITAINDKTGIVFTEKFVKN